MDSTRPKIAGIVGVLLAVAAVAACSSQQKNTKSTDSGSSGKLESEQRSSQTLYGGGGSDETSGSSSQGEQMQGPDMTLEKMDTIIREEGENVQGNKRIWKFTFEGVEVRVVTDPNHDRMRIMTPVVEASKVTDQQMTEVMKANFDSALDARYALSRGVLFSTFIHPLSTLDPQDFRSGIEQVANLAQTFGTSYSSGVLQFGGGR